MGASVLQLVYLPHISGDAMVQPLPTRLAAALMLTSGLLPAAHAVTVTESISLAELLGTSTGSYSGSFNIANLLSGAGVGGGEITSASLTAYGFSDFTMTSSSSSYSEIINSSYAYSAYAGGGYTYSYVYSYSCGWSGTCYGVGYAWVPPYYAYALNRNITGTTSVSQVDNVTDTMVLSVGSSSVQGVVDYGSSTTGPVTTGSSTRNNGTYGYDNVMSQTTTTMSGFSGELSATYLFSASDLTNMALSGNFDYLVGASLGSFELENIMLTMEVTPVPIPASIGLFASGLAGLAASARARRNRKKAVVVPA